MGNKKIGLKMILFMGSVMGFSLSFASTASFTINLNSQWGGQSNGIRAINEDAILNNMKPVHFADNGNDFGGFIYISELVDAYDGFCKVGEGELAHYGECVEFGDESKYVCKSKVRGFYYNSERGERLFPIDEETAAGWHNVDGVDLQPGLITNGGLYTECMDEAFAEALSNCMSGTESESVTEQTLMQCEVNARAKHEYNGYYGMVTHEYDSKVFGLIFGVNYSLDDPWVYVSNSGLAETFIRYENKYPVGLLFDYNGGAGFVGCEFTGADKTSDLRTLITRLNNGSGLKDMFEIDSVSGIFNYTGDLALNCSGVGMVTNSLIKIVVEGLVGMGRASDIGVIGNQSNKKMQFFKSVNVDNVTLVNYTKQKAETLCRGKWVDYNGDDNIMPSSTLRCINANNQTITATTGVTYIVKNGNVYVPAMDTYGDDNNYYDVYILSGNLLLDNITNNTDKKKVITKYGFVSNTSIGGYQTTIKEKLEENEYNFGDVAVGAIIKGNFVVNGNLGINGNDPIENRYFIYGKFTTKDTVSDLEDLFGWHCTNGISSDGDEGYCPPSQGGWENPYENAPLVIIDQNYHSPIYGG